MKRLENLKYAFLALSFVFWLVVSMINPIINLFYSPTVFGWIVGLNTGVVLFYLFKSVIPKAFKRDSVDLSALNLRTGSTKKKSGCSSCKKKK